VIRNDAESFRPNFEACPSFCKYLKQAKDAGVEILAKRVSWNLTDNVAQCLEDKQLEVEWPQELDTK
jgi:DNA-binding sugar fermentation-stimulating protein